MPGAALSRAVAGSRGVGEPGHVRDLSVCENREVPRSPVGAYWTSRSGWCAGRGGSGVGSGREGNAYVGTPSMNDRGKSDDPVVPTRPPNKPAVVAGAVVVEGSGSVEGNTARETRSGLGAGQRASSDLERVRQAARKDGDVRFTALLHHVTVDRLREAYRAISPNAAAGVDGVRWRDYGVDLEGNLRDLHSRVARGAFRAVPARRVFIPKADGRFRPLGVAALEDKILQRAVVEVLNAIYGSAGQPA